MSNLTHRQSIIQEKRKNTSWRDFVMEICSWKTLSMQKRAGKISIFSEKSKVGTLISGKEFSEYRETLTDLNHSFENKSFLENLGLLFQQTSLPNVIHFGVTENAEYADVVFNSKNVYLSFTATSDCENISYTFRTTSNCSNVMNSFCVMDNCDNVYSSAAVSKSSNVFYSRNISGSNAIWFSANLIGCFDCIHCNGLINQSYCIDNKKYSKEEYINEKGKILNQKVNFGMRYEKVLSLPLQNLNSINSNGLGLVNTQNINNGMFVLNASTGNNVFTFGTTKSCEFLYDVCMSGNCDHFYAVCDAGGFSEHLYSCTQLASCNTCFYSYLLESCSFCLGCVGLKNKSYCILNKQYTKDERYIEIDEIFGKMNEEGSLGEFFPPSMNPFYFNDTAAYLIDPSFTKEEVTAKGYLRRDEPIKVDIPVDAKVVKRDELDRFEGWNVGTQFFASDTIVASEQNNMSNQFADGKNSIATDAERQIDPEILKYVIQDEQGNYYRIIPMEYKFLMKHGLPLPRKHWLERMKENFRIS